MKSFGTLFTLHLAWILILPMTGHAQLRPMGGDIHEEMGRDYVVLRNDSLEVELGFDGYHGGEMVFDFVVVNRRSEPCHLDPADFHFVLLEEPHAEQSALPPRMAMSPDRVMAEYRADLDRAQSRRDLNSLVGILHTGVGILANTSAFLRTDDPGFVIDAVVGTIGTAGYYLARDRHLESGLSDLRGERQVVEEELFRTLDLPPGKVASGYVFFPGEKDRDACYMFCFPVEGHTFQFVYAPSSPGES
ncbi:MAG: hypothetical protein R2751_04785 [Bacteroidales bacterium]